MRKLMIVLGMLVSSVVVSGAPADAQQNLRFRDQYGNDRGTAWCLRPVYARGDYDCRYFTYAQCMATASGNVGVCEPNPFAVEQAQQSQAAMPRPHKSRRQYREQ